MSFEEHETLKYIEEQLDALGITYRSGIAGTGVIAEINTGRVGPVTAFRADIDALPLEELTALPYASQVPGVMHACGHDMHTGILLGLAAEIVSSTVTLCGRILFIFQPGEEANGGAQRVIDAGGLDSPEVDRIFALHVAPGLPSGSVAVMPGSMTATDDEFRIVVHGVSAHSSEPNEGANAVVAAAGVVSLLAQMPSSLDPFSVTTLSIASVRGGDAINVVPDRCEIRGMVRSLSEADKLRVRHKIRTLVGPCAIGYGASAEVEIIEGFPPVVNDEICVELVRTAAQRVLASDTQVLTPSRPHLGSEDFAYYQRVVPGAMFMLGCTGADSGDEGLHTGGFAPDESAIATGIAVMASLAALTNGSQE